jgi:hypothetical protein
MTVEEQRYRLKVVSEQGKVIGPEGSFEEIAQAIVMWYEEGIESVEGWVSENGTLRPMARPEVEAVTDRAAEILDERKGDDLGEE